MQKILILAVVAVFARATQIERRYFDVDSEPFWYSNLVVDQIEAAEVIGHGRDIFGTRFTRSSTRTDPLSDKNKYSEKDCDNPHIDYYASVAEHPELATTFDFENPVFPVTEGRHAHAWAEPEQCKEHPALADLEA